MTLKKKEREAIAKALRAAKKNLRTGQPTVMLSTKQNHICFALDEAAWYGQCSYYAAELARQLIMSRLHPWHTVRRWLDREVGVPPEQLTSKKVQAYRHRWVDSLIKEFTS